MDSRILRAAWNALLTFLQGIGRAIRQLFHEVTGAFFALFALIGAMGTWREWRQGSAAWLLALSAAFTLMMAYFAVSSFLRARRVQ